jgi:RecB family exonuclease
MTLNIASTAGRVDVTLALRGDGALPELLPDTLGAVTTGPNGLLRLLETQLGIPAREVSFTTRLIQYLACVDAVNHPGAFYHRSYQADPFSVARRLLQWRDDWYLAGWGGHFREDAPARLKDMAAIEQKAATAVDRGRGQRIQRVIAVLADTATSVGSITLRDPLADFPLLWRRLIEATAVTITGPEDTAPPADPDSDLGKLQRRLLATGTDRIPLRGDGSILILRAESPQDSAPLTASLCRAWQGTSPRPAVAVLAATRGHLLDNALESLQQPRLGFSELSAWRPVFQVLPLACELLWEPLNPQALYQFLSHPVGPVPARTRRQLAATVASIPGIGSPAWNQAVSDSLAREDPGRARTLRASIRYWLESPRFSPQAGVDSESLSQRARRVADWLQGAREASADPAFRALYDIALNQAVEFVNAVERLRAHGRDPLTRDNVRRLINDVRGSGAPITDREAEVCPNGARWLRADHPGSFSTPTDNVVWWDCQADDPLRRWPWSREEQIALAANGVTLQTQDQQLAWLGKAWQRPILSARQRCVLVLHEDAERHHPIYDLVTSLTANLPERRLAGITTSAEPGVAMSPLATRSLPPLVRWWRLPRTTALQQREAESFSSLDTFINSPYQWLLRYAARVRPGSLATVSDGNRLKGNLAHRLYQTFFDTHPEVGAIDSREAKSWADHYLPTLLQQEGALLLEPGRQAECQRFIVVARDSLVTLIGHLQAAAVTQVNMELWQEGHFAGGKLNGSIDLLALRADGQEAVVDVKWGGRKYRREALLADSYLQLAVYARLRRDNAAEKPPALSYFIVADAHMLSLDHAFFPDAEIVVPASEEDATGYWRRVENSWRWRKAQFDRGLIEVTVTGTEPDQSSLPDEDGLAIPVVSDGFSDYGALTGWAENE